MTLLTIIKETPIKELLRALNSDKNYLFFDVSVFNVGAQINIICTDNFKEINYGSWNGYDSIHENDDLIKTFIVESLKESIKNDIEKFKTTQQLKRAKKLIEIYS
jgi:hypothetical protein